MDHIPSADDHPKDIQTTEYWHRLADAIDEVQTLPLNEEFKGLLHANAVSTKVEFKQLDERLLAENTELFASSFVSKFEQGRYFEIKNMEFISEHIDEFHLFRGTLTINNRTIGVANDRTQLYMSEERDLPAIPIRPDDLTNFLLAVASGYVDDQPRQVEAIITASEDQVDDPWLRLGSITAEMGSIVGISSRTVRSAFPANTRVIMSELTNIETPAGSDYHHQLALHRESHILHDEIGLRQHESSPPDPALPFDAAAHHELTERDPWEFVQADDPFSPGRHAVIAEYFPGQPPEAVAHYGRLCMEFLASLEQLSAEQP